MPRWSRARFVYVTLAAATIAIGLIVHTRDIGLGPTSRDVAGDALWAMMMVWLVSTARPGLRLATRAGIALAISFAVELSQLYHSAWLDTVRDTSLGHLVLGNGFDPRDLASYTAGVFTAVLLDAMLVRAGHRERG